ncbi:MAG: DUF1015 domain-containing protein [Deltaproteobacteria bacterium]|nr:DUF1015 domain-containing protein [Deltaproteobacteria bacterium]
MSEIKPFRAIRPDQDLVAEIASPPYDVLDRQEVAALIERAPKSFMRVLRAEVLLDESLDAKDQRIYDEAKKQLAAMMEARSMVRDEAPSFYLYEQQMGAHTQVGVVAAASANEYFAGLIKKHEHTRTKDLDGRMRHIETLGVNAGPVFLTYEARPEIDALVQELSATDPLYDFVAEDEVRHRFWVVQEEQAIARLAAAFAQVSALYIADGHHRTEAGCQVAKKHAGDNAHVMAVIFPHDQVQILAYNRVVHGLNGLSTEAFLAKVGEVFEIQEGAQAEPKEPASFGMFVGGKWYQLKAKPESYDANDRQAALDVAILQNNLLAPILGIHDPKGDQRIEFVGGIRGARELERRATAHEGVGFYCYPTQMKQVMEISDAGEVMPPKSTWFEPKLRSGLFVRSIDD